jgi:hypothetical protein
MNTDAQHKAKIYLRKSILEMENEIKKTRLETGLVTNPAIEGLEQQIQILMDAVRLLNLIA